MRQSSASLIPDLATIYAYQWPDSDEIAQRRIYILHFWQQYGLRATQEQFNVSQRTLYRWKAKLRQPPGRRIQELTPKKTTPKSKRREFPWPREVVAHIHHLKTTHPYLGRSRIHSLLADFCERYYLPCPSESTVGRMIADMPTPAGRRAQPKLWRNLSQLPEQVVFMSYHNILQPTP